MLSGSVSLSADDRSTTRAQSAVFASSDSDHCYPWRSETSLVSTGMRAFRLTDRQTWTHRLLADFRRLCKLCRVRSTSAVPYLVMLPSFEYVSLSFSLSLLVVVVVVGVVRLVKVTTRATIVAITIAATTAPSTARPILRVFRLRSLRHEINRIFAREEA